MQIGMPYPIKKPMTAPSRDRIRLTSIPSTAIIVARIRQIQVNFWNIYSRYFGFAVKVMNYCRVRNTIIGRTEKFWKRIPAWTSLPSAQKMKSSEVWVELTQSKIVEYYQGRARIFLTSGEQERLPINPTQKQMPAPKTYPKKRSRLLFPKSTFLFKIGAAIGCTKNDNANAPATLEKSALKYRNYPRCIFPSTMCRIRLNRMKIAYAAMQYMEYPISFKMKSVYFLNRICFRTSRVSKADHCREYFEKVIQLDNGALYGSRPYRIAELTQQKFRVISMKQAMQTKKKSSILTTLLILSTLTPPILRMDQLQVAQSGRLCMTNNLQVAYCIAATITITRGEITMPLLTNKTGQIIIAEPIIQLVIPMIVLEEESVPAGRVDLRREIWFIFYYQDRCLLCSIDKIFVFSRMSS